jgi:Leucine-rich repeat (LRR) protein
LFLVCFVFTSITIATDAKVTCSYELNFFDYACHLKNQVIISRNDTLEIEGVHINGYSDQNVTALRTQNSIVKIFPSQFALKFKNLKGIFLQNVSFETLIEPFENCQNINIITFSGNPIKLIPFGVFSNCTNLESLNFIDTEINQINENAFESLKFLKTLTLKNSKISNLGQNIFKNLAKLEVLSLSGNIIEDLPGNIFWPLTELLTLNVDSNNISEIKADYFKKNMKLTSLNLDDNYLNFLDETESSTIFEDLRSLKTLTLKNNMFSRLPAFKGLENLEKLDLSSNKLRQTRPHSYEVLTNLQELILNNNQIVLDYGFLMFSKNLMRLSLENNQITNINDRAFDGLSSLKTLNLAFNNLTRLEAKTFKGLNKLTELDLSYNEIVKVDREIFKNFQNLFKLNMKGNQCASAEIIMLDDQLINENLAQCFNGANATRARWFVLSAALLLLIVNQVL